MKILSDISDTDQVKSIRAENVSNAAGTVISVDVHFTLEVRLEGVVARTNDGGGGVVWAPSMAAAPRT